MENHLLEYLLSLLGIVIGSAFLGGLIAWPLAYNRGYLRGFEACSEIWAATDHSLCEECDDPDCEICSVVNDDSILDAEVL